MAGTDQWTVTGTILSTQDDGVKKLNFGSGFYSPVTKGGNISQAINTVVGQSYTISFYLNKKNDNVADGYAGVELVGTDNAVISFTGLNTSQGATTGFQLYSYTFLATADSYFIRPTFGANIEGTITGLIVNIGYEPKLWTMAPDELFTGNTRVDINGITVNQVVDGVETGRTKMTPDRFAGYFDVDGSGFIDETKGSPDEVFRMDKDEFVMKKAVVKEEITMGTLKQKNIISTAFTGSIWISNNTE
jgi:hypothetical protein